MGDFEAHFKAGKQFAVVIAVMTIGLGLWWQIPIGESFLLAVITGVAGLAGSLLPDIDHQDSKPRQAGGKSMSVAVIVAVLVLPSIAPEFVRGLGRFATRFGAPGDWLTAGSGVLLIAGFLVIFFGGRAFDDLLTHRGLTHSLPFAFMAGVGSYFMLMVAGRSFQPLASVSGELGVVPAIAVAGGILLHLSVDGHL